MMTCYQLFVFHLSLLCFVPFVLPFVWINRAFIYLFIFTVFYLLCWLIIYNFLFCLLSNLFLIYSMNLQSVSFCYQLLLRHLESLRILKQYVSISPLPDFMTVAIIVYAYICCKPYITL